MVNWELINYCLTDEVQLPLHGARNSGGIYAPTLRYHDGMVYMITTNVTGGGNFIVHTNDIRGRWPRPGAVRLFSPVRKLVNRFPANRIASSMEASSMFMW